MAETRRSSSSSKRSPSSSLQNNGKRPKRKLEKWQILQRKWKFGGLMNCSDHNVALEILKEVEKLTRAKKLMEEAARPF